MYSTPSGKNCSNSAMRSLIAPAVSSALAPGASVIAIAAAGSRLKRPVVA